MVDCVLSMSDLCVILYKSVETGRESEVLLLMVFVP